MPSAVIHSFRYHAAVRELEIEFTSGRRYRYLAVPPEAAEHMRSAFSKGQYFNRHIRDHFAFVAAPCSGPAADSDITRPDSRPKPGTSREKIG